MGRPGPWTDDPPPTKSGAVQYVHLMEEAILPRLIPGNTSVWVFPSENPETHLAPDNFYSRVYMTALEEAKLEGVTWHTLRHGFASWFAMNSQAPATIVALLRHSGTDLGTRYAHLAPSHLQEAREGVSGFGKVKRETAQTGLESKQEGQNSNLTVTGTGTEREGEVCKSVNVLVGARGFEPPTSCSQSRRATGLRYAPTLDLQPHYTLL